MKVIAKARGDARAGRAICAPGPTHADTGCAILAPVLILAGSPFAVSLEVVIDSLGNPPHCFSHTAIRTAIWASSYLSHRQSGPIAPRSNLSYVATRLHQAESLERSATIAWEERRRPLRSSVWLEMPATRAHCPALSPDDTANRPITSAALRKQLRSKESLGPPTLSARLPWQRQAIAFMFEAPFWVVHPHLAPIAGLVLV